MVLRRRFVRVNFGARQERIAALEEGKGGLFRVGLPAAAAS
jgi:hypothetical protein